MSDLSSILAVESLPTANATPSCTKAIHFLLLVAIASLLETQKSKPRNVLTSPAANAFTVLKSLEVTSVVPNRSEICFGDTTMYLFSEGSTSARSMISFACLNLAIVKPAVPASVMICDPGSATEVPPATPVSAAAVVCP